MSVCLWTFSRVSVNKSNISPLLLSRNFSPGTVIASFTDSTTKWCFVFVANPCFLIWLHTLGKIKQILQRSIKQTQTKQKTNSIHWYRKYRNMRFFVFFCFFFPLLLCICVWTQKFPWVLLGKVLNNILFSVSKFLRNRLFFFPLLCFCPFLFLFFILTFPPVCWGQRCSRFKGALKIKFTPDETNRFACAYPPETVWPAPGKELYHLRTA